jgi:hypothetical protein
MSDAPHEFVAPRGPQGRQGEQGGKGDPGEQGALPRSARRSLIARDVAIILLLLLNFVFTARYVNTSRAAEQRQQAAFVAAEKRQQEAAARAGTVIVRKLCTSFGELAELKPPAGNPKTNPSRRFEQQQHATLDEIGPDLGCR